LETTDRIFRIIVIGGSAGSIPVVRKILSALPSTFHIPVVICLHRLTDIKAGLVEALETNSSIKVLEPDDKIPVKAGYAYVAPANYHLLIEPAHTFALSIDEKVNFSRPAIDLTFETSGLAYRRSMLGIILSGANMDGARGLYQAHKNGAYTIVQDPEESLVRTMPEKALETFNPDATLNSDEIIKLLNTLK